MALLLFIVVFAIGIGMILYGVYDTPDFVTDEFGD